MFFRSLELITVIDRHENEAEARDQNLKLQRLVEAAVEAHRRAVLDMEEKALKHRQQELQRLRAKETSSKRQNDNHVLSSTNNHSQRLEIRELQSDIARLQRLPSISSHNYQHPYNAANQISTRTGTIRDAVTFLYSLVFNPSSTLVAEEQQWGNQELPSIAGNGGENLWVEEVHSSPEDAHRGELREHDERIKVNDVEVPPKKLSTSSGPDVDKNVTGSTQRDEPERSSKKVEVEPDPTTSVAVVKRVLKDWTTLPTDWVANDPIDTTKPTGGSGITYIPPYVNKDDEIHSNAPVPSVEDRYDWLGGDKPRHKDPILDEVEALRADLRHWTRNGRLERERRRTEIARLDRRIDRDYEEHSNEINRLSDLLERMSKNIGAVGKRSKSGQTDSFLYFVDIFDRTYKFPYDACKTWEAMEDLISQSVHDLRVNTHEIQSQYYLIGHTGEIILPQVWDKVVEPGHKVWMQARTILNFTTNAFQWTHELHANTGLPVSFSDEIPIVGPPTMNVQADTSMTDSKRGKKNTGRRGNCRKARRRHNKPQDAQEKTTTGEMTTVACNITKSMDSDKIPKVSELTPPQSLRGHEDSRATSEPVSDGLIGCEDSSQE